jgi:hypothetical protein
MHALLFIEATEEHAHRIDDALRLYERCTCQLINPAKCSMLFGVECRPDMQEKVK